MGRDIVLYCNSAVYIIHHLLAPLFSFALPSLFFLNKIRDREKKVEIYTHTHTHIIDC